MPLEVVGADLTEELYSCCANVRPETLGCIGAVAMARGGRSDNKGSGLARTFDRTGWLAAVEGVGSVIGSGRSLNTGGGVNECKPRELLGSGRSWAYEYSGDGSEAAD